MKGIRGSTEYEKQFLDIFHRLCHRHHAWQVWQDFVSMSACSIANAVDKRSDIWKQREDSYLKIVKRYSKDELDSICELFGVTVLALDENPAQDFLGKFYMQLDFGSGWHGQFFTPWHVAEFMAKIQMGNNLKEQIRNEGYISVNDSCCGAGCMLMAFANACKSDMDINYQQSVLFIGQDIDEIVAKMCYIQISLLGCPGYVVVGNSLSEPICGTVLDPNYKKTENIWFTPLYFTDVWTLRRIGAWNARRQKPAETLEKDSGTMLHVEPDESQKNTVLKPTRTIPTVHKPTQKPAIKKSAGKKKTFSWKQFFTAKGKREE